MYFQIIYSQSIPLYILSIILIINIDPSEIGEDMNVLISANSNSLFTPHRA